MWWNAVSPLAKIASKIIDEVMTSDEEREEAKLKFLAMAQQGKLKELETSMSVMLAEAKSMDAFTSRARPTFLYLMYFVIILCFGAGTAGLFWPDAVSQVAVNIKLMLGAIPDDLWWLFGMGYLGYSGARSFDKRTAAKGSA